MKIPLSTDETSFLKNWLRDVARLFEEGDPSLAIVKLTAISQTNRIIDSLQDGALDLRLMEARFLMKLAVHFLCPLESPRIEAAVAPFRPILDGFTVKLIEAINAMARMAEGD
jgi:hypothetical protein